MAENFPNSLIDRQREENLAIERENEDAWRRFRAWEAAGEPEAGNTTGLKPVPDKNAPASTQTLNLETDAEKIEKALKLFFNIAEMSVTEYWPEYDKHKWARQINREALDVAKEGIESYENYIQGIKGEFSRMGKQIAEHCQKKEYPFLPDEVFKNWGNNIECGGHIPSEISGDEVERVAKALWDEYKLCKTYEINRVTWEGMVAQAAIETAEPHSIHRVPNHNCITEYRRYAKTAIAAMSPKREYGEDKSKLAFRLMKEALETIDDNLATCSDDCGSPHCIRCTILPNKIAQAIDAADAVTHIEGGS